LRRPGAGRRFGRVIWPLNGYEGLWGGGLQTTPIASVAHGYGLEVLGPQSPCAATGSRQALLRKQVLTPFGACGSQGCSPRPPIAAVVSGTTTSMGGGGFLVQGVRFGGLKSVKFGLQADNINSQPQLPPQLPTANYNYLLLLDSTTSSGSGFRVPGSGVNKVQETRPRTHHKAHSAKREERRTHNPVLCSLIDSQHKHNARPARS
jgi:hypothetical protein